ncbi:hypothetical protein F2Q70_00012133 [Brassica cretica]|uniref:Uncharacterized protein n=1 Tax=Brassica cretica TaxID=69181 RepID=A0A8S9M7J3_BRACR|nr:hypothetical protein F2Q70_00012133 [Brassica cretica]
MRYLDTLSTQMMNTQKELVSLMINMIFRKKVQHRSKGSEGHRSTTKNLQNIFPTQQHNGLDSQAEWLQKEVKAIQRQLASQHQISASIDREKSKSIDSKAPATIDKHLVASIHTTCTPDDEQLMHNNMESMQEQLNELSEYVYNNIGWYQFSIEDILERLQNISNAEPKLASNTKPDINACLGAWYTWDNILQTSLEAEATRSGEKMV